MILDTKQYFLAYELLKTVRLFRFCISLIKNSLHFFFKYYSYVRRRVLVLWFTCGGQRATSGSQFYPSAFMWVPRIQLSSVGLFSKHFPY